MYAIRSYYGWAGRILLGGLSLVLVLIVYLLVQEAIVRKKYRVEYPPPGQMVSLETHDIHLHCVGEGSPAVIFEADLDQYGSLSWASVQGEIGKYTRACSYDRAGILWSEPGPRPRDGETIAAELKTRITSYNVCYTKLLRGSSRVRRTSEMVRTGSALLCFLPSAMDRSPE